MLIDDYEEYFATPEAMIEYQERRKDYRRAITERRNRQDDYSRTLDEAGQVLEFECKQILRPKTLREFLFSKPIKATAHDWSEEAKKVLGRRAASAPPPEQPR